MDYQAENEKVRVLISELAEQCEFKDYIIQNRVKTPESIAIKKQKNFPTNYEITDISGIRLILQSIANVREAVEKLVRKFKIDYANSIFNPLSRLQVSEFGYLSSHVIIENNGIKTEIQIRTMAQHIWAITSHKLSYKENIEDSIFSRDLFRLSGLLEQVDINIEMFMSTCSKN